MRGIFIPRPSYPQVYFLIQVPIKDSRQPGKQPIDTHTHKHLHTHTELTGAAPSNLKCILLTSINSKTIKYVHQFKIRVIREQIKLKTQYEPGI